MQSISFIIRSSTAILHCTINQVDKLLPLVNHHRCRIQVSSFWLDRLSYSLTESHRLVRQRQWGTIGAGESVESNEGHQTTTDRSSWLHRLLRKHLRLGGEHKGTHYIRYLNWPLTRLQIPMHLRVQVVGEELSISVQRRS